jgi:hypothetical protein
VPGGEARAIVDSFLADASLRGRLAHLAGIWQGRGDAAYTTLGLVCIEFRCRGFQVA